MAWIVSNRYVFASARRLPSHRITLQKRTRWPTRSLFFFIPIHPLVGGKSVLDARNWPLDGARLELWHTVYRYSVYAGNNIIQTNSNSTRARVYDVHVDILSVSLSWLGESQGKPVPSDRFIAESEVCLSLTAFSWLCLVPSSTYSIFKARTDYFSFSFRSVLTKEEPGAERAASRTVRRICADRCGPPPFPSKPPLPHVAFLDKFELVLV